MAKEQPKAQNGAEVKRKADGKPAPPADKKAPAEHRRQDGWRETVESIVIAFILAFLFRTFEAEAFVIPTGSMAPTLLGRHKDVTCSQCGYKFRVGASYEVDDNEYLEGRMQTAFCPNCRYEMPKDIVRELPVYKGDRILVNKFPFEFTDPERWDVVVFKYPEHPETNYIKRLVGLPGETLEIRHGDLYRLNDGKWEILRKADPEKQRRIQLVVYDNDHPEKLLHEQGWPMRWSGMKNSPSGEGIAGWSPDAGGWQPGKEDGEYVLAADSSADGELRWLRYQHILPEEGDWRDAISGKPLRTPRPQLISDFCGYNSSTGIGPNVPTLDEGYYWDGDLTLNAYVDIQSIASSGDRELLLELIEGARKYRCRVDLTSGIATLTYIETGDNDTEERPLVTGETTAGQTPIKSTGTYRISFANVDDRLCLWVDDELIKFSTSTEYTPDTLPLPQQHDLIPIGIAARGAAVRVSHLLLQRDIYYRSDYLKPELEFMRGPAYDPTEYEFPEHRTTLYENRFDPAKWAESYQRQQQAWMRDDNTSISRFVMGPDEFLMFGDNSPSSLDSRLWRNSRGAKHRYAVPRSALVGKAFFVYWPHGVPFLNDGKGYSLDMPVLRNYTMHQDSPGKFPETPYPSFRVPFYPQIDRMRRIR